MINYKTDKEIELMRISNLMVSKTHAAIAYLMKPGTKTIDIDKVAEQFIRDNGGVPGFLNYHGFPNTLCISVNSQVVHGIPSKYELKEGDIVSVDCGVVMNGFNGDSCYTFAIGEISDDKKKLLKITREALYKGIEQAKVGNRIGDIGYAIQKHAENQGYGVVRELVGHGIGKQLHEAPEVPNYGKRGKGIKIKNNLTIAIEPMINMGTKNVKQSKDGWTISTIDNMPSAHFEHTIAIKNDKTEILSNFEIIDEEIKKYN